MRILFLGNSFTFFNDLPDMVGKMLDAEVGRNLRGGAYLFQHIDPTEELCAFTHRLLTEEKWDYVVLQDQSQGPITHPAEFDKAVSTLAPMIRAAGGKPILYETWAYEEGTDTLASTGWSFEAMQQGLTEGYRAAAEANGALIAAVGQAFAVARHTTGLYDTGHYHPSAAGSRLAAETIANVIRADQ